MSKPPHNQRGQHPAQPQAQPQGQRTVLTSATGWSGPLPPPEALEKFNRIIPNGADRIVTMAEKEQAHRIQAEAEGLSATVAEARRGQFLGAAIAAIALAGAIFTAYIGAHWSVSVAMIGLTILGIIRAIIRPRQQQTN